MESITPPPNAAPAERRRDRRLRLPWPVTCRRASGEAAAARGMVRDICPGGLYVQFDRSELRVGDRVQVSVHVPPTPGVCHVEGCADATADVIRAEPRPDGDEAESGFGYALRFRDRARLSF